VRVGFPGGELWREYPRTWTPPSPVVRVSEQLTLWRDSPRGFALDREYRNTPLFRRSRFLHPLWAITTTQSSSASGDKHLRRRTSFIAIATLLSAPRPVLQGLRQGIGKNTAFDFGYRRHSDEFCSASERFPPWSTVNNHIDEKLSIRSSPVARRTLRQYENSRSEEKVSTIPWTATISASASRARGAGYANLEAPRIGPTRSFIAGGARGGLRQ